MSYAMKPLACDPQKIKGLPEKLIVSHYENNYGGAVKRLNTITAQLAETNFATTQGYVINGLKREELVAYNSMVLHELYFESLGASALPASLQTALEQCFGSVKQWEVEFAAMGKALAGGSGWVLLTWSQRDNRLLNQWALDHTHAMAGCLPLLALDMYEHSYHMEYGAKAAAYVDAFMENIHYRNVGMRLEQASRVNA
jgi:Fe-Mn family superoxide dismutase